MVPWDAGRQSDGVPGGGDMNRTLNVQKNISSGKLREFEKIRPGDPQSVPDAGFF